MRYICIFLLLVCCQLVCCQPIRGKAWEIIPNSYTSSLVGKIPIKGFNCRSACTVGDVYRKGDSVYLLLSGEPKLFIFDLQRKTLKESPVNAVLAKLRDKYKYGPIRISFSQGDIFLSFIAAVVQLDINGKILHEIYSDRVPIAFFVEKDQVKIFRTDQKIYTCSTDGSKCSIDSSEFWFWRHFIDNELCSYFMDADEVVAYNKQTERFSQYTLPLESLRKFGEFYVSNVVHNYYVCFPYGKRDKIYFVDVKNERLHPVDIGMDLTPGEDKLAEEQGVPMFRTISNNGVSSHNQLIVAVKGGFLYIYDVAKR